MTMKKQPHSLWVIERVLIIFQCNSKRSKLSSVLEPTKSLSIIENTSEIAALALKLLSNQTDNRVVAEVSRSIVYDKSPGQFGKILKKDLDVNKAVFIVDFLENRRRKYTQQDFTGYLATSVSLHIIR